jgi:hypothetical protein
MPPIDPSTFEKISEGFRLVSFHVDNPYILIPQISTCVSVTLTISQVTDQLGLGLGLGLGLV